MPRKEKTVNGTFSFNHKEQRNKRKETLENCGENPPKAIELIQVKKIKRELNDVNEAEDLSLPMSLSLKSETLDLKPTTLPELIDKGNLCLSSSNRKLTRSRAKELEDSRTAPTIHLTNTLYKDNSKETKPRSEKEKKWSKIQKVEICSKEPEESRTVPTIPLTNTLCGDNSNNPESVKETVLRKNQITKSVPIGKTPKIKTEMKKFVGAHLSITGGLENAIHEAMEIGAKAVGLFLKSQRTWKTKPLEEKSVEKFKEACKDHGYPMSKILPHGSYLVNCGSSKPDLLSKSRENLIDDLHRCDRLGIQLFNFHPGSTCGEITVPECVARIAESINIAHIQTDKVTVVIENMSCQGHTIGGKFEELRDIIDQVKNKQRIGVCLDTCHAFAAGFDISTEDGYEQMMADFENIIGLEYLKAIHLNDSKGEVGCHKDRHENIGKGKIGLDCFRRLMNDPRLDNIPMILETPLTIDDQKEIEILYAMVGKGQ